MRIAIVGAGPAGLYLGYRVKRRSAATQVEIIEQNPPDTTFGFGVVFSDRALEFLNEDDPDTCAAISAHLRRWDDVTVVHRGERIRVDGIGFAAIGRLHLLRILQERGRSVGITPSFNRALSGLDELAGVDLVVGADGVNSVIRRDRMAQFGATIDYLTNRFAWFGTTKQFETLTQTFRRTKWGHLNAHHYPYAAGMSTFIVEVDQETYLAAGLAQMSEVESKEFCEQVFSEDLGGHALIANKSVWRRFPKVWSERWFAGNCVLVGDALRTAHFSIGSGTRLAMEDAIALDSALARHPTKISAALSDYERRRRPIVEKLVDAANRSAAWYENFPSHMSLDPMDFAMSYLTRSGRMEREKLRAMSPQFVGAYEATKRQADASCPQSR